MRGRRAEEEATHLRSGTTVNPRGEGEVKMTASASETPERMFLTLKLRREALQMEKNWNRDATDH